MTLRLPIRHLQLNCLSTPRKEAGNIALDSAFVHGFTFKLSSLLLDSSSRHFSTVNLKKPILETVSFLQDIQHVTKDF
jgi:hypothetical protein